MCVHCNSAHANLTVNLQRLHTAAYAVAKGKEGAARVVVAMQHGVVNSYTLESSLAGKLGISFASCLYLSRLHLVYITDSLPFFISLNSF
jgi:hypothetical protein